MSLTDNPALDAWLARALDLPGARVTAADKLSGGAIQENWAVTVAAGDTTRRLVIRRDAPATIAASRSRGEEYALIAAAHRAGVRVPQPLASATTRRSSARPLRRWPGWAAPAMAPRSCATRPWAVTARRWAASWAASWR
ncbi:phosphotransferase [Paracoccus sp. PAMC 22219]|uniref:phosphotransferase n=1 Tax=Paracoccus sp. PAMC 22219 TaxID=1569209 RepID=UPI000A8BF859|nr:phosphotransferase [Paracoccus sp. PAMC 22219]